MIFDKEPANWEELQSFVGQLFEELGCAVDVSKEIDLVRGRKEIDVFVRDTQTTPASIYLCECKYWKRAVPQEVVHSFRTVVSDQGAHRGYIISRTGFQSGARAAVANTNIDLLSFDELQVVFFERWRIAMGERFMPYADRLFPYWDYPGKRPSIVWDKRHVERQHLLVEAYRPFVRLGPTLRWREFEWELPIQVPILDVEGRLNGHRELGTYRQIYDFLDANKDCALREFQILYGEIDR